MSKSIGVMGTSDFVLGFNLAGVRNTWAVEASEFPKAIEKLLATDHGLGILIVEGQNVDKLPQTLRKKVNDSLEPVVVSMGEGAGEGDLRDKVKRAIGIDLFKN